MQREQNNTKLKLLKEIEKLNKEYYDTYFYCKEYKDDQYMRTFYIDDMKFISNDEIESFIQSIEYSQHIYYIYNIKRQKENNEYVLEEMSEEYLKTFINCMKNDRYYIDETKCN